MTLRRPSIDAIVFDPRALLDPPTTASGTARARAGSRRLLDALARNGVGLGVLADEAPEPRAPRVAQAPPHESPEPTAPGTMPMRPDEFSANRLARLLAEAGLATDHLRLGTAQQLAGHGIVDGDPTLLVVAHDSSPDAHPPAPDDASDTHPRSGPGHQSRTDPGSGVDLTGGTGATHGDTWPARALPRSTVVVVPPDEPVHPAVFAQLAELGGPFTAACLLCGPLDDGAVHAAEQHQLRLTKPPGSLGRIETVGTRLAGIAAAMPPPPPHPAAIAVFAGDHGVHRQGVSPWPQEVTMQMVANFLGGGAAINVLARQAGAGVVVVDVGVAGDLAAAPGLLDRKVRRGTADLSTGPAMDRSEAQRALDAGAQVAARLVADGARCLVTGDMGIANTTPSAALVAALTGRPAAAVTGRGTGIGDDLLARKTAIVERAAARARERHGDDALAVLAEVGGLEHAALAGFVVGGVAMQVPVVLDGVIAAASLLVAARLVPGVEHGVIAGHRSVEPGAAAVLGDLGLDPLLDLELRLGEGTGAALALRLVEAAARVLDEMATFDQAGVSDKNRR